MDRCLLIEIMVAGRGDLLAQLTMERTSMGKEDRSAPTDDAQTSDLLGYETVHHASAPSSGGSPRALEETLASISAEVTAEALERLAHVTRLKQQRAKTGT